MGCCLELTFILDALSFVYNVALKCVGLNEVITLLTGSVVDQIHPIFLFLAVNLNFFSSCRQQLRQNDDDDAVRSDAAATCAADAVRNHPSGDDDAVTDADACAYAVNDADSS